MPQKLGRSLGSLHKRTLQEPVKPPSLEKLFPMLAMLVADPTSNFAEHTAKADSSGQLAGANGCSNQMVSASCCYRWMQSHGSLSPYPWFDGLAQAWPRARDGMAWWKLPGSRRSKISSLVITLFAVIVAPCPPNQACDVWQSCFRLCVAFAALAVVSSQANTY